MEMEIKCPACSTTLTVEDTAAGSQLKCPNPDCGTLLVVPAFVTQETEPQTPDSIAGVSDELLAKKLAESYRVISAEVAKAIVGQDKVIEHILIAIFAGNHCLLEGVPGLAKTYMINSLAKAMALSFNRVQFTPDLMPSDITGTEVIDKDVAGGMRGFIFKHGPIFAQLVLADEINRSPPKTQAALLEAMQEHTVTIGGQTHKLYEPFFVLATQNPIEQEGTYNLPEAQRDRFMFHIEVEYPKREEESDIIKRTTSDFKPNIQPVITGPQILQCQEIVRRVPVPKHVNDYVLNIVRGCRPDEAEALPFAKDLIEWGPGPRACQQLILGGKVRAIINNRPNVTPEDIAALAHPVLRHRIVPTFNAEADGITVNHIIDKVLAAVSQQTAGAVA
jgi:MoxR-like ATPase